MLSDTNNSSMKSPSNRFAGQINRNHHHHHRTSSSPVPYPPSYEDNVYVNAAPRLSDSDSSSELPYQRMFINSHSVDLHRPDEVHLSFQNQPSPCYSSSSCLASHLLTRHRSTRRIAPHRNGRPPTRNFLLSQQPTSTCHSHLPPPVQFHCTYPSTHPRHRSLWSRAPCRRHPDLLPPTTTTNSSSHAVRHRPSRLPY